MQKRWQDKAEEWRCQQSHQEDLLIVLVVGPRQIRDSESFDMNTERCVDQTIPGGVCQPPGLVGPPPPRRTI